MNRKEFIKIAAAAAVSAPLRGFGASAGNGNPKVYFTSDISPEGLLAAYRALGDRKSVV